MMGIKHFAIGVDIECIKRFQDYANMNKRLYHKIFTPREIKYCFSKPHVAQHLAARFAAKEAIIKAFNSLGKSGILYCDIEIINKKNGVPTAKLHRASLIAVSVTLSLSHCQDHVVAMAAVTDRVKSANRRT